MSKKVTIHDLARELNIDSSTVSRALSDSPRVKQKTKELVQKKAQEMGYLRNTLASNLRSKKTQTIGVVVPHISRFFLSTVISGIEEVAFENNYRVIICQSQDSLEREQLLSQTLLSSQVDGLIMSISMETDNFDHLRTLEERDIPIVFVDRNCSEVKGSNILIDDYQRALEATEHLIQNGCTSIAHFTGSEKVSIYKERLNGYLDALKKNNLTIDESLILKSGLKPTDGEAMAKKILARDHRPNGIFSANDLAAISAMQVLQQNDVVVPNDIAIIGFSNEPLGAFTSPALSSVDQNPNAMGKAAAQTLFDQIDENSLSSSVQIIPSSLVVRASSKRMG